MKRFLTRVVLGVALLAGLGVSSSRASVLFNWSFLDVNQGGANTIAGTLLLPDLCATSCTGAAATSVIMTTAPIGPIGFDFIGAVQILANIFDTVSSVITLSNFNAYDDPGGNGSQLVLQRNLPSPFQLLWLDPGSSFASDGWPGGPGNGSSIDFAIVPEPASLTILASLLAGLGLVQACRRRPRAAKMLQRVGTL